MKNRKKFTFILKLCISIGLIAYVITKIDFSILSTLILKINMGWLTLVILLIVINTLTICYRWFLLLRSLGCNLAFKELLRIYLVCNGLGSFTPGGIGSDVLKVYGVSPNSNEVSNVIGSVVIERFLGILSLIFISFTCMLFTLETFTEMKSILLIIVIYLALVLLGFLGISNKMLIDKLDTYKHNKLIDKVIVIFKSIRRFRTNKLLLVNCFFLSVVGHFQRVFYVYIFAIAIGIDTPLIYYIIFIPIIFSIKQLPISINGIGINQGLYIWFFGHVGMSSTEAFTLSTGLMILGYGIIMIGGILYMTKGIYSREKATIIINNNNPN